MFIEWRKKKCREKQWCFDKLLTINLLDLLQIIIYGLYGYNRVVAKGVADQNAFSATYMSVSDFRANKPDDRINIYHLRAVCWIRNLWLQKFLYYFLPYKTTVRCCVVDEILQSSFRKVNWLHLVETTKSFTLTEYRVVVKRMGMVSTKYKLNYR